MDDGLTWKTQRQQMEGSIRSLWQLARTKDSVDSLQQRNRALQDVARAGLGVALLIPGGE
jgi:hypothetical protein